MIYEFICETCKKQSKKKISIKKFERTKKHYCSRKCISENYGNSSMEVICLNCNVKFMKRKNQIKKSKNNFCCKRCNAIYNNKITPKRIAKKYYCLICKEPVKSKRKYCDKHNPHIPDYSKVLLSTIKAENKSRSTVAGHARSVYNRSNKPKCCVVCGYSMFYDVAHIKPVSSFDKDTPLSEVSHIDNLVALCPNHHCEFDAGMLSLQSQ